MSLLLAVDPSINCSGVALFKGGLLVFAVEVNGPGTKYPLITRVIRMAASIAATCESPDIVVLEWPQIYTKGTNDRNDLLGLAGVCGAVGAHYAEVAKLSTYLPKEWTGNVPKSKNRTPRSSPRGVRIARRLDPEELKIWSGVTSHDVVDAVGLGLHALGRLDRKRMFPGAKP